MAIYSDTMAHRKCKLSPDLFTIPIAQKIGFYGEHFFMINAAPLTKFHSLILPYFKEKLCQDVTEMKHLLIPLEFLRTASDPKLTMFFNCWGAGATLNHMHFQLLHFENISPKLVDLPIEKYTDFMKTILKKDNIEIGLVKSKYYIIPHFVIRVVDIADKTIKTEELASVLFGVIDAIRKRGFVYNLILRNGGNKIYVVPRSKVENRDVEAASAECSGILVCKVESTFEKMTADNALKYMEVMKVSDTSIKDLVKDIIIKFS